MIDLGNGDRIAVPGVSLEALRRDGVIDPHERYQSGLTNAHLFPVRDDRICACGCSRPLPKRRIRWATDGCGESVWRAMCILNSDGVAIAYFLRQLVGRECAGCGCDRCSKEVDHIVEVADGGGGLWIENFQLLCHKCHVAKTNRSRRARSNRLKGAIELDFGGAHGYG